jgi:hypothetical protein
MRQAEGERDMARLGTPVKGFERKEGEPWAEYDRRSSSLLDKLVAKSEKVEGIVGGILYFPVCDGRAMYLVTKESPLTLSHIPYGDRWTIPVAHIRGLTKRAVEVDLENARALTRLFARGKAVV